MPSPHKDESKNSFMDRCMKNKDIKRESKNNDQAVAICLSKWRKRNED